MRKSTRILLYEICKSLIIIILFFAVLTYFGITIPNRWAFLEGFQDAGPELSYTTDSKIKVFTYATHMKPTLKLLLESLKAHNYSYEVVGYGDTWKGFRNRVETYLRHITQYKQEKGDNAVAVVVDGYDCLCIKDSEDVYNSFYDKPRKNMPVIFGTEVVCLGNCKKDVLQWYDYHDIYGGKEELDRKLKTNELGMIISDKSIFLNAGMLIGEAAAIEKMYIDMLELKIEDDQVCAGTNLLSHMGEIDLDVEELIFRNKVGEKKPKTDDENGSDGPGFLHFPGAKDKENFTDLVEIYKAYV